MKDAKCLLCPYKDKPYVGPEGKTTSPLVIIGEAPGAEEERTGRPFVGGAGQLLDKLMFSSGLVRQGAYITNVLKCRPDGNKIDSNDAYAALRCCTPKLLEELKSCTNAHVVVPTGNTPLRALGYNYNISQARGFVLTSQYGKVIPTWHPAYIMRQYDEYLTGVYDWRKIAHHLKDPSIPVYTENFTLYPSIPDIERWVADTLEKIESGKITHLGCDLETTYVNHTLKASIKLIGFATSSTTAFVVPIINQAGCWTWNTPAENAYVLSLISRIFENPKVTLMFHNSLFDVPVLMNHKIKIKAKIYDTMLARFMIYNVSQLSLAYTASIYTDVPPWKLLKGVTDHEYRAYNARDCCVLHDLKPHLDEDMQSNDVQYVFDRVMRVILPTAQMMLNGIWVDNDAAKQGATQLVALRDSVRNSLRELTHRPNLNPNSQPQLREVLFDEMKLKSSVHTDSGKLSVANDVLNRLALRYPENEFVSCLLEYAKVSKLVSTYAIPKKLATGRVHSEFKLTIDTGRYGSENPNLQNIPKGRTDEEAARAKLIRMMYAAPPGKIIISGDLSQAELITTALIAEVREWLDCIANKQDIHKINGDALIGEYDKQYRTFFKNFIFGFIYGSEGSEIEKVAPKDLISRLSVTRMITNFQERFPELYTYRANILKELQTRKRLRNLYGRTRFYVGELTKEMIRSGYNFPIQSTVADFIHGKVDMLNHELDLSVDKLILQLHDALYLEVAESRVDVAMRVLREVMEYPETTPAGIVLKYTASIEKGYNLANMKEIA